MSWIFEMGIGWQIYFGAAIVIGIVFGILSSQSMYSSPDHDKEVTPKPATGKGLRAIKF